MEANVLEEKGKRLVNGAVTPEPSPSLTTSDYNHGSANSSDEEELVRLEARIETGVQKILEAGKALKLIRDKRLYKDKYKTFEDYCRERWGFSKRYANYLISAADVGTKVPISSVAQGRALSPLYDEDKEEAIQLMADLKQKHGADLTATVIKRAVTTAMKRRQRLSEQVSEKIAVPIFKKKGFRIEHCGFLDLEIEDGTVDLILTDPPYLKEYLPLWDDLAKFASRVLKPGGLLVTYSGQFWLPQSMKALENHLEYVWLGTLVMTERREKVWGGKKILCSSRPILFYSKDKFEPEKWLNDTYRSDKREKDLHKWQQPLEVSKALIASLSKPGDLVLDPCLGSGTNAVAASELGRNFIGCDCDPKAVEIAINRLKTPVAA